MGSLLANGAPPPSTSTPSPATIENDGFWPGIDLDVMRKATRLTGNVTDERLRAATVSAMIWANTQLAGYKAKQLAAGWDSAADVGESLAGASVLVHRYTRAVTCAVQAEFAENYRDWDNTRAGDFRADFEGVAANDFRRNANWALSEILGRGRSVVELI